jgi:hypothetical protein
MEAWIFGYIFIILCIYAVISCSNYLENQDFLKESNAQLRLANQHLLDRIAAQELKIIQLQSQLNDVLLPKEAEKTPPDNVVSMQEARRRLKRQG